MVADAPYNTCIQFISQHKIDFVAHGDDVTTDAEGLDTYRFVKQANIYLEFARTQGVSTTDAIARILFGVVSHTPDPHFDLAIDIDLLRLFGGATASISNLDEPERLADGHEPSYRVKGHKLVLNSPIGPDDRVVYLHGSFDLFSVQDLEALRKLGQDGQQKVIVGIWGGDVRFEVYLCAGLLLVSFTKLAFVQDSRSKMGRECILSFQERALGVLQCRVRDPRCTNPYL